MSKGLAPLISVRNVSHGYGDRVALNNVSFEVFPNETFGLLGRNGSGKSTMLGLLSGALSLQKGDVTLMGSSLRTGRHFETLLQMAMVFQDPSLDHKLSVAENLLLYASLYGISRRISVLRMQEALQLLELEDRIHERVSTLSGGLKRRVDIARAWMSFPQLLLMDEPTAGLDEASFQETWKYLKKVQNTSQLTIVVATHRPEEAGFCDHVVVFDQGIVKKTQYTRQRLHL